MGDVKTLDEGVDEFSLRLCERLGIDPEQTTRIELSVEPGKGAVARWDGYAQLPLDDVSEILATMWDDVDAGPAGP